MSSSQFDSWLAMEVAQDAQEKAQAQAWQRFLGGQAKETDAALYADPAYHAWVDEQAARFEAAVYGQAI
jgi:hypothetical protein